MSYQVNPLSVLILPKIDEANDFNTIVYEAKKDVVMKVYPFGYWILRTICFNPGLDFRNILKKLQEDFPNDKNYQNEKKAGSFIDLMVSKEVIKE